jgi:hypothetical protein
VNQVLADPTPSSAVLAATGPGDVPMYGLAALLAVLFGGGMAVVGGSRRQRS